MLQTTSDRNFKNVSKLFRYKYFKLIDIYKCFKPSQIKCFKLTVIQMI